MIITLSGLPGSGKSTIGKELAKQLDYKFYSIGDLRGKIAVERGLTIDELNEIGKKEDWTDKRVDDYQKELGETEDNLIFDGRISFHFIPQSFKVFLDVDLKEAAKRIFKNQRTDEKPVDSEKELEKILKNRIENDKQRYLKYYKLDYLNESHYDLIIDTTNLTVEQIVEKITKEISKK